MDGEGEEEDGEREVLSPTRQRGSYKEVLGLYGVMLSLTVGLGWAQSVLPWIGEYVLFFVALGFLYLPTEYLLRRGEDPRAYGIGAGSLLPSVKGALWISLLVLLASLWGEDDRARGLEQEHDLQRVL